MPNGASAQGYYRYPTIAADKVVFVSEDDLWQVDRSGGIARRITAGWGSASRPWLSPNGQYIAFVGREEGDSEVYVMPAQGGEVHRLTYWGTNSVVVGWNPAGEILFSSNYGRPFMAWHTLYAVNPQGGDPTPLPYGPATAISFGPRGQVVLGRNTGDYALRKRYRGGTRGMLWIQADDGHFRRFDRADGNLTSPMWIGDRIYFLSDHEGIGNLYSITPDGQNLRRHTDHGDFYARNASTDGQNIVYHAGGSLYLYDPDRDQARPLAIDYRSQKTQRERKYVSPQRFWTEYALDPKGDRLLITTRGKLYALGNWNGPVEQVGVTDGVRYRLSRWTPDGRRVVTISDETGEETLEIHRPSEPGRPAQRVTADMGRALDLAISPNGQFAALANHRLELWMVDLDTLEAKIVDVSDSGPVEGMDWSPDSRWLAYALPTSPKTTAIKLYHLPTNQSHQITRPVLLDTSPVFDPAGRYLYFLSYRTFDPVYDSLKFDLGFPNGGRPYLMTLSRETPSPFVPVPAEPWASSEDTPDQDGEQGETREEIVIDLEGIADRIVAFPVPEGRYQQLGAQKDKVFWTTVEPQGSLKKSFYPGPPPAKARLIAYDLKDLKSETLAHNVTSFTLSADRSRMAIRSSTSLRVVRAADKVDSKNDQPGRTSGIVDFDRIVVSVDPAAEWYQMIREAWRLMRDNFWTADMSDVDWEAVLHRYLALVPRIASRREFSDLVWEMQGELGTSHAYEMGGDVRPEPANRIGFLAADLAWDPNRPGYRIVHLVQGDSWTPEETSPLLAPGVHLKAGDVITHVDGQVLGPALPPAAWLVGKAKRDVRLSVLPGDGDGLPRQVVIRPLEADMPARYREWVRRNHQLVADATGGRVGYIHIPDMGPRGYSEFYRGFLVECLKEALIVDVRFNGGGHVSSLILENLVRRRIGYDVPRHGLPMPYPADTVIGPVVALTNEHAGSDGDIFSHSFKLMGIGPLLGTRTWGGVIGINVRHSLVDGGITTQPEFSFWFQDVGWGVENWGTEPDIEIYNTPDDYRQGVDRQLHRAIEEALHLLEVNPPHMPHFDRRPSRRLPTLPPRP